MKTAGMSPRDREIYDTGWRNGVTIGAISMAVFATVVAIILIILTK